MNNNELHDLIVKNQRRILEKKGCFVIHLQSFTVRKIAEKKIPITLNVEAGWPDLICIQPNGAISGYEIKTGNAVLNASQRHLFPLLIGRGMRITLVRYKDRKITKEVLKCRKES